MPIILSMDFSGSTAAQKPPWESFVFQQSSYLDEPLLKEIGLLQFTSQWNERSHEDLNEVKAKIEPLEKNHSWETLKKKTNPYELVYTQENQECPQSISILKPLSRSYFKMIEILELSHFFDKLPKTVQKIRSAHVAEGPGGFIEAVLDRASLQRLNVSKVFAMTLKPTNNHIPGWRRAYTFLQKHPEIKISYGEDGTGDLYKLSNQMHFVHLFDTGKASLFTGDGGFDFSVDYENQERSMFPLLLASAITGLQVLGPEGTLVLKMFDLFSSSTQLLLRLVTYCFKEWVLYKPSLSRPCNSERYLVCRGFRKVYPGVLHLLQRIQVNVAENKYPQTDYFSYFTEKERKYIEDHIAQFNKNQIENIEKTIALSNATIEKYDWKLQYQLAYQWCSQFRVPTIKVKY